MERYFRAFLLSILVMFSIVSKAEAAQFLSYPFSTNQDSRVYNDFNDHASYCMGCQGNDYDVPHGTPLYAVMDGTVDVVDGYGDQADAQGCDREHINYGNYVKITNGSWEVIYGHMAKGQMQVTNGALVVTGQLLGYTSNSGYTCGEDYVNNGLGSSYHLHFEVEYNNVDKDPYPEGYFIIDSDGSYNYPDEADGSSSSGSTSRSSKITTEFNSLFSTYNIRNERKNECSGIKEDPNFMLDTVTDSLHWWNYSGSGDPNPSSYYRDDGKYTTLLIENYDSDDERYCADDGAIVYDEFGGANRAYTVQCDQWNAWRMRNGPEGAPTQSYPQDCGAPITNVYGKGTTWVQDFQDCIIVLDPNDDNCDDTTGLFVRAYPNEYAPGELADGTWDTVVSYQFAERYERGGASKRFGYPIMGVSSANGVSYQTFRKGEAGRQRTFYDDGQSIKIVSPTWFQSHVAGTLTLTQLASYADEEETEITQENEDETDADNDSWSVADGDCNDLSNGVHPTHEELSDAVDNDCDDVIDEDLDNDGVMTEDGDCNDLSNGVYPTHPEDVDNRDNNCDGLIDNDPYSDLMVYYPPIGGWWTAKNWEGDTLTYYTNLFQGYFTQGAHEDWYRFPKEACDVNGDLFTDIIVYSPAGEWTVIESDEDTLPTSTSLWATSYGTDSNGTYYEAHCGDFNGDGYDDAMLYALHGAYYVRLSNGSSFQWSADNWMPGCTCGAQSVLNQDFTILVGDFNGDTLDDVLLYHLSTGTWYVGVSTGSGFNLSTWYTNFGGPGYTPLVGDINGDTLDDITIMSEADGHWNTLLSTGTSFAQQAIWIEHHGGSGYQPFLEDMNGDTLDDAIIFTPSNGSWSIALSTGSSFSTPSAWITNFGTDATGTYGVVPFITKTHR